MAVLPDGHLVSGSEDGSVRVWDLTRGESRWILEGHWGTVTAVAIGPGEADGSVVASGSYDGTIRLWDPQTGVQAGGTFDPGVVVDQHAAVLSDGPALHDDLNFASHVSALARLITAMTTVPPLAIALLAPWGGGKSSFMRQLAATISSLSGSNPHFVRAARVVEFNAWHYSDTSVLIGLVTQVFRQLRTPPTTGARAKHNAKGTGTETPSTLRARIKTAEEKVARRRRAAEQVGAVETADAKPRSHILQRADTIVRYFHGLRQFLPAVRFYGARLTVAVTGLFLLLLLEVVVAIVTPAIVPQATAWLTGLGITLGSATFVGAWYVIRKYTRELDSLGRIVQKNELLLGFVQEAAHIRLARAEADLATLKARDALSALLGLLEDNARQEQLESYRGVVGHIEDTLAQLAERLQAASTYVQELSERERAEVVGADLYVDRVVLHIDDLDRCTPDRVVEVLQAVALLQSSDLFVVLVSVDPRWLRKSLAYHETTTFAGTTVHDRIGLAVGEPLDYLDKVFQIPFALPPLTDEIAGDYLIKTLVDRGLVSSASLTRKFVDTQAHPAPTEASPETISATSEALFGPSEASASGRAETFPALEDDLPGGESLERNIFTPINQSRRTRSLALTWYEARYLATLTAVLSTPRTVKKLLNLYQLIRLGTHLPEHARFTDEEGEHLPAGLLLALVVGTPAQAAELFRALEMAPGEALFRDLVISVAGRHGGDRHPDCHECSAWSRLCKVVDAALQTHGLPARAPDTVAPYVPWAREVSRFSFHTEYLWRN